MIDVWRFKAYYKDPLYHNSCYLMINNILGSALGFFFWIVVARTYSASDIGIVIGLISASGIITNISKLGLDFSIIRFIGKEKEKTTFINTCLTTVTIITLVVTLIFYMGIDTWAPRLNIIKDPSYLLLFFIFNIINALFYIHLNVFIALRDVKYFFLENTIFALIKIPLAIFLASTFAIIGILGAWSISMIIAFYIGLFVLTKKVVPNFSPYPIIKIESIKELVNFSIGNYIVSLLGNAPLLILPLIILHYLPSEDNAYFFLSFSIASILYLIPGAFSMSLFAEGSFDEALFSPKLKQSINHTFILLIPSIVCTGLFAEKFLLIFGSKYSENGSILLSILALAGIFVSINSFYNTYLRINFKITELIVITAIQAILILGLSYGLLHFANKITSVGVAYLIAQGVISIYVLIVLIKLNRFAFIDRAINFI